jgi:hypothetical protein
LKSIVKHLLAGAACATLLSTVAFAQEASAALQVAHSTQTFRITFTGACHNNDNFSFTGTPIFSTATGSGAIRVDCEVAGDGTHGHFLATNFEEEHQEVSNSCNTITASVFVLSFDVAHDQLFLKLGAPGSDCINSTTGVGNPKATYVVLGGTGRFAGATGSVTANTQTIFLALSALGGDGFLNAISGTMEGSIVLK